MKSFIGIIVNLEGHNAASSGEGYRADGGSQDVEEHIKKVANIGIADWTLSSGISRLETKVTDLKTANPNLTEMLPQLDTANPNLKTGVFNLHAAGTNLMARVNHADTVRLQVIEQ